MATNSASTSEPAPWSVRQLWQVPVFLLGVLALAGFVLARSLWLDPAAAAARSVLAEARRILNHPDGDVARAMDLARSYLDRAGPEAPHAGEAHFLIGSALLRTARTSTGKEAEHSWRQVRDHLEQAAQLGVSPQDEPLLRFRLGLSGLQTGMELHRAAQLLAGSVEESDDKVEGYRALARVYLSLSPPDLGAALKANEELRQLPLLGEDILGPARVQAGDILLRLHQLKEARKVLEKVSPTAPASLRAEARALRAQTYQDEENWAEAAPLWREVLADHLNPPAELGRVLYQLGLCYRRLEQPRDAARVWRECLQRGSAGASPSHEAAVAAALGLADVLLAEADPTAIDALERAVHDLRRPEDWKNSFLGLKKTQAVFEHGCTAYRDKGDFEHAVRVAELYERVGPPAQAALLLGQGAESWAQSLRQRSPKGEDARATALFRRAGGAYARAADQAKEPREQSERLWSSAGAYLRAQDAERAVPVLRRFLDLNQHPDFTGEAWYLLAEAYRWLKNDTAAEAAYNECAKYPGRFSFRARYRLSQVELQRHPPQVDRAVEILDQNIRAQRSNPDPEALEKSLFALGGLLYRRHDYQTAQKLLEEAVSQFPNSPQAKRGRFELAECWRNLAAQLNETIRATNFSDARQHYETQQRAWLVHASEQYTLLGNALSGPVLTPQEQVQALFSIAECRFNLGEYDAALQLYDQLAERFKGRAEQLNALGGSVRCYAAQNQAEKLAQRLQEIRLVLKDVDEETRHRWEEWLKLASSRP